MWFGDVWGFRVPGRLCRVYGFSHAILGPCPSGLGCRLQTRDLRIRARLWGMYSILYLL